MPVYRSTAVAGPSTVLPDRTAHRLARKLERQVEVRFTSSDCLIRSQEGTVNARAGDAILTGVHGERWRVSRARFGDKYRPVPPTQRDEDGRYVSNPIQVTAVQMREPFEVVLVDGCSILRGVAGDWLVDYGDGSLGIVSQAIFPITYELIG